MELIKSINNNQIEQLKKSGLSVSNFEVTMQTETLLNYFIDIEINEKKFHIIIGFNWESKDGGIHVYDDKENVITNYELSDIESVDDLNKEVTSFITNNFKNWL